MGIAEASEAALHRSISGWIAGRLPSFRKRRSSASEAERYCVGFSPILAKVRRHAWISGRSLSDPAPRRSSAIAWKRRTWSSTETSLRTLSMKSAPTLSSGKSRQISSACWKCMEALGLDAFILAQAFPA
ncbi:hypothetical protein N183_16595 [Sinorhizobium sp. Sb3]|nr:hypothetical protein N183_16595 [Sinorhizobium sp. Sb3]